eukprot:TRINITY_DN33334_c0_g1_i1.p3 TRINITY_DN33334_c0_g1~~TRINITY_DN33334_c0_g1_i1.p3  ORF type:complete len:116 (-),score=1.16 TRINITY_DN33334_c0_g1_i1:80-427(-)
MQRSELSQSRRDSCAEREPYRTLFPVDFQQFSCSTGLPLNPCRCLGSRKSRITDLPAVAMSVHFATRNTVDAFLSCRLLNGPIVQRPRTPGFHPGNRGSNPLGVNFQKKKKKKNI